MTQATEFSINEELLSRLSSETYITLYPLTMRIEDEEYIVGRVETGEFVALPEIGGQIIELFQQGFSLGEAQAKLEQEYDSEVELDDFVISLADLGFVKEIDGHSLDLDEAPQPNLAWLQAYHVSWLFSLPALFIYTALLVIGGYTFITHIELFPIYQDFFWSSATSVIVVINTVIVMSNLAAHELAHLVAARSLGIPARIGLGTRLQNLVVQTDVTGLWAVPRRQRYRVYLAGMLWELGLISTIFLLLAYVSLPTLVQNLLQALVLAIFVGLLWQFEFYMRTDMYYVVMDLLRCHNLFEDSLAYLRYQGCRLWHLIVPLPTNTTLINPLDQIPDHERRRVSLYAWFVLVGSTISLSVFIFYGLPIMVELFIQALKSAWQGITQGKPLLFLDGTITLLIEGGFQAVFIVTFFKSRRHWLAKLRQIIFRQQAQPLT